MHFWFEPTDPLNLGLCRVLFFGVFFLFYLPQDFSGWGEVSDVFWTPIPLFEILHIPVLSSSLLVVVQNIWKLSLALSCLGLFTRASTVSSFILGLYLLGLPQNFGETHHYDALVVIVFGIMALSRCGDACSIDRLIRKARRGGDSPIQRPQMSGEYTWPVRAVWLMLALIFFGAGVSKLRHSGLEWIFSDNMALLLIHPYYYTTTNDPLASWGLFLAQYKWLYRPMAAATIVLEVSYPLALISRRARWVIVPGVFFLQAGIRVLMGPSFIQFLFCNLFWIPWDRVARRFGGFGRLSLRKYLMPYDEKPSQQGTTQR